MMDDSDYNGADDFERSILECYRVVRERMKAGGKPWPDSQSDSRSAIADEREHPQNVVVPAKSTTTY